MSACYEGSEEHKLQRWWGGLPAARHRRDGTVQRTKKQQTTICGLVTEEERDRATTWVQKALRLGNFKHVEGRSTFPKRIYYKDDDNKCWEGRVINPQQGSYKGWPVSQREYDEIAHKLA